LTDLPYPAAVMERSAGQRDARIRIGTAGWSIPRANADACPGEGTHLQRYARVFGAAEINSSFHRPHQVSTYRKWADHVPDDFRFAVKLPRAITHDARLRGVRGPFEAFLEETAGLGAKRGPLLVQVPPSLEFDRGVVRRFFAMMRRATTGAIVCEPRHRTWFTTGAEEVLREFGVSRVAADPPPVPGADRPGGAAALVYYRLHGSPRKYWSSYDDQFVLALARRLAIDAPECWCIFDNTASGAALANALELQAIISDVPSADGSGMGKQIRRSAAGRRG